jgi:hypothetical protein
MGPNRLIEELEYRPSSNSTRSSTQRRSPTVGAGFIAATSKIHHYENKVVP